MAVIFADGYDNYAAISDLTLKYVTYDTAAADYGATYGRLNTRPGVRQSGANNRTFTYQFATSNYTGTVILSQTTKFDSTVSSTDPIWYRFLNTAGTTLAQLTMNRNGAIQFHRGTGAVVARSTKNLRAGVWGRMEIKFKCANSGGLIEVKFNGETLLTFTGDTSGGADGFAQFRAHRMEVREGYEYVDDVIIQDETGASNTDYLGDIFIEKLTPTGDSSVQFTPQGAGSNYVEVDDVAPDGDTTYNSSATATHKDLFTTGTLSATVDGIASLMVSQVSRYATTPRTIKSTISSSAVEANGPTRTLTTSYAYYQSSFPVDPNTSSPWVKAAADAALIGYELVS